MYDSNDLYCHSTYVLCVFNPHIEMKVLTITSNVKNIFILETGRYSSLV